MTESLVHRGPDEDGYYIRKHIGLGMRRLSIVDVCNGHQPACNEQGDIRVILNGEIYNHEALRKDLLGRGHDFRTRSDTEVIAHLYEEDGDAFVEQLDGMFALALYDERPGRDPALILARDRVGKKPLYYAGLGGCLIFGSEIKALLKDNRISREVDEQAVHHYLSLLMIPAPYSIFKGIRKLPAGSLMRCDRRGPQSRRYWNYLQRLSSNGHSPEGHVSEVRQLLFQAVEKRLADEVPMGAFLSGGLDSSAVVAITTKLTGKPVETFSVGFEGPSTHDELDWARMLATHCGAKHHEIRVRPDAVQCINDIIDFCDEPFAISSAIPTLLLSRAAREHVKVVLTGDGGDETFGGYAHYLFEKWARLFRVLPPVSDKVLLKAAAAVGGDNGKRVAKFVTHARESLGRRRLGWAAGFSEDEKAELCPMAVGKSTSAFLEEIVSTARGDSSTLQNCLDMIVWLPDEMLTKVDRMTMASSLEARCPLLDYKLIEYTAGLSFNTKVPTLGVGGLKHVFREAAKDLLPLALLNRPKHGFNVPLDSWFRDKLSPYLRDVLSRERIRKRGLLEPEPVARLVADHSLGQIKASSRLYALMILELWMDKQGVTA